MARILIALVIAAAIVAGIVIVGNGLRAAAQTAGRGRTVDVARAGMIPKLSYGLLVALIVYATLTAGGA